jgi:RNA polymerase sigma factor (TIGR02999 family)
VTPSPKSITQLLIEWREGDQTALNELVPLVYEELRRMAHRYMRGERPGHSLQTTDLIDETWQQFPELQGINWQNRAHFYAVSAIAMRRILVDHARKHQAQKRAGKLVSLDQAKHVPAPEKPIDVLALHEALEKLAVFDPRKSQIVEMKYFGGMTINQIAEVLGISTATVSRELKAAEIHLKNLMQNSKTNDT